MRKFKGQSLIEIVALSAIVLAFCTGVLFLFGGTLSQVFKGRNPAQIYNSSRTTWST